MKRIYIDTSVIGGCFDPEFEAASRFFFKQCAGLPVRLIVSDLMEQEISRAPQHVRDFLYKLYMTEIEKVKLNATVTYLAKQYITEKVVGGSSIDDCHHIALASLYADIVVSWNFKHIVNVKRIK
jgi:predicted nucleic acid-binding protein